MKYDRIEPHHTDTPIPNLSDEEIEARVFRNLEAQQKAWEEERASSIVIMQYPETRSVFQRFVAWWRFRYQPRAEVNSIDPHEAIKEPAWPRHWGTTKYL